MGRDRARRALHGATDLAAGEARSGARRAPIVALAAAFAAGALAACRGAAPGPAAFVVDDGVKVGADGRLLTTVPLPGYRAANPAWNGSAVTLAGARGETVAFQVIVQAGPRVLRGVDATPSALRRDGDGSALGSDRFARFREWYHRVTVPSTSPGGSAGPGEYPDALVPAATPGHGLPVDVPPGGTQGIWLDLSIPRDAAAGTYRGELTVSAAAGRVAAFPVVLTVHGFALPVERHLPWRVGYSGWEAVPERLGVAPGTDAWHALERDLYRLLWQEHRAAPTTHYHRVPLPVRGAGEALEVDWTGFDRRFGAYLDGSAFDDRVPLDVFSLPLNLQTGWPQRLPADPAQLDVATITALARRAGRHWDERGWRIEDAFVFVADEPDAGRLASARLACEAVRRGDPRIRTSVALYTEMSRDPRAVLGELAGAVTLWDVAGDHLDLRTLRGRQAAGDRVEMYQGGEPYQGGEALDDDGLALTTWPWIAWRYGLDGLFLYNATEWDYARLSRPKVPWASGVRDIWVNPLNQSWATNSQGVLVYPGPAVGIRGVVGSIRLKQVRRGQQDYEYLWLLARRGGRAAADAVAARLVPRALHDAAPPGRIGAAGAWSRDPRDWARARAELAAAIVAPGAGAAPTPAAAGAPLDGVSGGRRPAPRRAPPRRPGRRWARTAARRRCRTACSRRRGRPGSAGARAGAADCTGTTRCSGATPRSGATG